MLAAALCAGCGNHDGPEPASVATVESSARGEAGDSLPRRIYYDLTKHGWYSRAEPLVYEQRSYVPRGAPISIPLAKLHLSGNYQGVDYYTLRDDAGEPDVIYVPVHERYWLPFGVAAAATTN